MQELKALPLGVCALHTISMTLCTFHVFYRLETALAEWHTLPVLSLPEGKEIGTKYSVVVDDLTYTVSFQGTTVDFQHFVLFC